MIFFVVALQSEANPLIDYYKLKLYSEKPFRIYRKDNYWLVISGIGKLNSAAATSFLSAVAKQDDVQQVWLNIGIAGQRDMQIGELIIAHKIIDNVTQKNWYPPIIVNTKIKTADILSVDVAEIHYPTNSVYDMEAFAFYSIATKLTTSEFVQVIKIISDNKETSIQNITKNKIHKWISDKIPEIDFYVSSLEQIAQQLPSKNPPEWEAFLHKWNFTLAGKKRLHNLLQKWHVLHPSGNLLDTELFIDCHKMKQVLNIIEKECERISYEKI